MFIAINNRWTMAKTTTVWGQQLGKHEGFLPQLLRFAVFRFSAFIFFILVYAGAYELHRPGSGIGEGSCRRSSVEGGNT